MNKRATRAIRIDYPGSCNINQINMSCLYFTVFFPKHSYEYFSGTQVSDHLDPLIIYVLFVKTKEKKVSIQN